MKILINLLRKTEFQVIFLINLLLEYKLVKQFEPWWTRPCVLHRWGSWSSNASSGACYLAARSFLQTGKPRLILDPHPDLPSPHLTLFRLIPKSISGENWSTVSKPSLFNWTNLLKIVRLTSNFNDFQLFFWAWLFRNDWIKWSDEKIYILLFTLVVFWQQIELCVSRDSFHRIIRLSKLYQRSLEFLCMVSMVF